MTELATAVVLLTSALSGLVGVARLSLRWLNSALDRQLNEKLAPIKAELQPNGGTSLRDRVDQLTRQKDAEQVAIDRRHGQNRAELDELREGHVAMRRALRAVLLTVRAGHQPDQNTALSDAAIEELDQLDR